MSECIAKTVIREFKADAQHRLQEAIIDGDQSYGHLSAQISMCEDILKEIKLRQNATMAEALAETHRQGGKNALKWLAILFVIAGIALFGAKAFMG